MSDAQEPFSAGPYAAEIKALLEALKGGIEATVTGIFDGARARLHASSEKSPGKFWAAFNDVYCLQADWTAWDRELLVSERARIDCRCGAHAVEAYMFSRRWILIVLSGGPLVTGAGKVIDHALAILGHLLPVRHVDHSPAAPVGGGPGLGGQSPAALGIPASWIRRRATG